jgi:hypothetical protein
MLANRLNSSSTPSPENADTSTTTGMLDFEAHLDATSADTSRPSGDVVAVHLVPERSEPALERTEASAPTSDGSRDCLLDTLDAAGVCGSGTAPDLVACPVARSALFPARIMVKFGLANALASIRNVGSWSKLVLDPIS